ncbi:hypothetical protein EOM81_10890 [bacterium]|nr:hypothetical protein [bacterium]
MDIQDLKNSLQNIENRYKIEKIRTIKTYCDANNPYKVGDTFTDYNCTIRIENIRYYCSETNPCCIYEGVILRKDGTPRKDGKKESCFQSNERK